MKKTIVGLFSTLVSISALAGGIISVNFGSKNGTSYDIAGEDLYGLAPAIGNSWTNIYDDANVPEGTIIPFEDRGGVATELDGVTWSCEGPTWVWYMGETPTDKLLKYYPDDNNARVKASISGIPYKLYDVIIYYSSDSAVSNKSFRAVTVNEVNYTYDSALGKTVQGTSGWGCTGMTSAEFGVNAIRVENQMGSTLTLRPYSSGDYRRGIAAFQIVEKEWPTGPSVISVNCGTNVLVEGNYIESGLSGAFPPAYSWSNVNSSNAPEGSPMAIGYWDGSEEKVVPAETSGVTVEVNSNGEYHYGSPEFSFMEYYIDDSSVKPQMTIDNIPFRLYDVIVYLNCDWIYTDKTTTNAFNAVKINDVYYTYDSETGALVKGEDAWGQFGSATAAFGVNALKVEGLSAANLVINTNSRNNPQRGGLAAVQVVRAAYEEYTLQGDVTTEQLNRLAGSAKILIVNLDPGATLTICRNSLSCEELRLACAGDIRIATHNSIAPTEDGYADNFAKINTDQVTGLVFHGWEPSRRILSVNLNADKSSVPQTWELGGGALSGVDLPWASWNNLPAEKDYTNSTLTVWDGEQLTTNTISGLEISWTGAGYYGHGSSDSLFRRGWMDANQSTDGGFMTVSGIPFDRYDVIVYQVWDGTASVRPPKINGEHWTWDAENACAVKGSDYYGTTDCSLAASLGTNAVRVTNLTGSTLTIAGQYAGNICAFQVIEYCPPVKDTTKGLFIILR